MIAQFCSSLSGEQQTSLAATRNLTKTGVLLDSTPASQINVVTSDTDLDQQDELENIIHDLEEENMYLMEEYNRLQNQLNSTNTHSATTQTLNRSSQNNNSNMFSINKIKTSTLQNSTNNQQQTYAADMTHAYHTISSSSRALSSSPATVATQAQGIFSNPYYTSSGSLNVKNASGYNRVPPLFASVNQKPKSLGVNKESQMLAEARLLRQHEDRLEARMKILENHNRLLDGQLKQLRSLLNNVIF